MGTTTNDLVTISREAGADLRATLYHFVRNSNGADQVNISSLDTASDMLGVQWTAPSAAGRPVTVLIMGLGKVVAGAAIASLDVFLTCDSSGRAVVAGSGDMTGARAMETATAAGDVVSALIFPPYRFVGPL